MNDEIVAPGYPSDHIRTRARHGAASVFPPREQYGRVVLGARHDGPPAPADLLDTLRLAPPVFMPRRLEKLIELGREPMYGDVATDTPIGGFRSPLPLFIAALGSTRLTNSRLGEAISRQAGRLGLPMVIGENLVPVCGYGRLDADTGHTLFSRIHQYCVDLPDGVGGVAIQQSTEDADAEVWNLVYSDPSVHDLLLSGRLAFELKVGQGAKPGLGGMTLVDERPASALADRFTLDPIFPDASQLLRSASPGTFTEEILRQQIHMMRNNFPRAKVWVKLHPGRDIRTAAMTAWAAGADAVTVDGAEGGSGWAPLAFLDYVGLPLGDCLLSIGNRRECLLASGRVWDGPRAVKCLALGARAVGLGRAALLAASEDRESGLVRLVQSIDLEVRLLVSALGKYATADVSREDLWPLPARHDGKDSEADLEHRRRQ
ncbi:Isopentenyl-diphosphate delta-isomerase (plasmid) [Streptomyces sp. enrichment culture]|uniref:glutamate synthase-related protein n=1 Tax=Streptomyces sp. enrichment culture TaxID=1795815 RepID=UPI003F563ACF